MRNLILTEKTLDRFLAGTASIVLSSVSIFLIYILFEIVIYYPFYILGFIFFTISLYTVGIFTEKFFFEREN